MNSLFRLPIRKIFGSDFRVLKNFQNSVVSKASNENEWPKYHFHFLQNPTEKYEILKKIESNVEIRKYPSTMCHFVRVNENEKSGSEKFEEKKENDVFKNITNHQDNENTTENQIPFYLCRPFPKIFQNSFGRETGDAKIWIKEIPEMVVAVSKCSGQADLDDYLKVRNEIVNAIGSDEAKNYDFVNLFTSDNKINYEVWLRRVKF